MNVYAINHPHALSRSAKVFNGTRWVVADKDDIAAMVAGNTARHIMAQIDSRQPATGPRPQEPEPEQEPQKPTVLTEDAIGDFEEFTKYVARDCDAVSSALDVIREESWLVAATHPQVLSGMKFSATGIPNEFDR